MVAHKGHAASKKKTHIQNRNRGNRKKRKKGNAKKKHDTARSVTARETESTCSCPSFLLSTFICMFSSIISVFPFSFACLSFLLRVFFLFCVIYFFNLNVFFLFACFVLFVLAVP